MNGPARRAGAFASIAWLFAGCARDEGAGRVAPPDAAVAPAPTRATEAPPALARIAHASPRVAVSVQLPARADLPFRVVEAGSGVGASVRVSGARPVAGVSEARGVRFPGAVAGGELVHAVLDDGAEDSLVLAAPPARGELRWRFAPTPSVAGLRLVDGVLELLDVGGAPRLRVDRPFTRDAAGERRAASLDVEGCAVERSPAPPWGRAHVAPAASCTLVVRFDATSPAYPLVIDPIWRATASMAVARAHHRSVQVAIGGARLGVLVVGGDTAAAAASAELFDVTTSTWSTAAAPPGTFVGEPVQLEPNWLFVGSPSAFYDATAGTWISTGAPAASHLRGVTARLGADKALLVGGLDGGAGTSSVEIFDPAAGTWAPAPPIPEARFDATASALADKVLVAGGSASSSLDLASCYVFDPASLAWSKVASTPSPIARHRAFAVAGGARVLLMAQAAYEYDPLVDAWKTLSPPLGLVDGAVASYGQTAIFAGGLDPVTGSLASSALRYDVAPTTSTLSRTAALVKPRRFAAATVLANGSVLLSGGVDAAGATLGDAEILSDFPVGVACSLSSECATGAYCASGTCAPTLALGTAATDPETCASGFVADGVCCDTACTGACAACDLDASKGTCTAIAGAPRHGTCAAARTGEPCSARACDGVEATACAGYVGADVDCRDHGCAGGVETMPATCDGKGACAAVATKTCAPYACDGLQCRATCRADPDCQVPATCDATSHVCVAPACIDDHTAAGPTGLPYDCGAYHCANGACVTVCASTDDCLSAYDCDVPSGRCVLSASSAPAPQAGGGCSASGAGTRAGALASLALALAMVARRRDRR